jgi:hypothetical protein
LRYSLATGGLLRQAFCWLRPEKLVFDLLRESQTAQPQWLPTSIDLSKIPEIAKFADLALNF